MFTGIITNKARVESVSKQNNKLVISNVLGDLNTGTSISVDGACLSVKNINKDSLSFDISQETFKRTIINNYTKGDTVNIELPMSSESLFSGHLVLGHVDTVGIIAKIERIKNNLWNYYFSLKESTYIVDKGSIAINGISLTTNIDSNYTFYVSVIEETFNETNLSDPYIKENSEVNIEYDIIGKYVYKYTK